jgi:hypothetical protein
MKALETMKDTPAARAPAHSAAFARVAAAAPAADPWSSERLWTAVPSPPGPAVDVVLIGSSRIREGLDCPVRGLGSRPVMMALSLLSTRLCVRLRSTTRQALGM